MLPGQVVRRNKWCQFERIFSNGASEIRYVREIVFGKRHRRTYWEITTDPETMPENTTSFVMTNLTGQTNQIKKILGNLYGLRTWIEYGFRQCKQELGWTDYRLTKFEEIEKWWEIIMSAYLLISLNSPDWQVDNLSETSLNSHSELDDFSRHQQWSSQGGWKSTLNNLRLIIQPTILLGLIFPWLDIFPNRHLLLGFQDLILVMNQFPSYFFDG